MVTIRKRQLEQTTLYSVWCPDEIPTLTEHKNCIISITSGYLGAMHCKYIVTILDDANTIVYQTGCNTIHSLDEIKVDNIFYDKTDAIKYYERATTEAIEECSAQIASLSSKLNELNRRLEILQK